MESSAPPRATIGAPRVRDRVIRLIQSKVSGVEPLPTEWASSAPSTGLFQPTSIRVTYSRDGLNPHGPWDIGAVVGGAVIRKDGTPGSRAATRTWIMGATDVNEPDWPEWVRTVVVTMHPTNLPSTDDTPSSVTE